MGTQELIDRYRSLGLLLVVVVASAMIITNCGDGGSSSGDLCSQCGVSPDGPCQPSVFVSPGPNAPPPCDAPSPPNPCEVDLICRRKVDSAQQRCFPKDPNTNDVNFQFRCDGARPGGTVAPVATPTLSPTPATSAVPQTCGNDIREGTEECDGGDLNNETCDTQGCGPGGILSCRVTCMTFNFELCNGDGIGCGG